LGILSGAYVVNVSFNRPIWDICRYNKTLDSFQSVDE